MTRLPSVVARIVRRALFSATRPDLLLRRVRRLAVIEITADEIARYVPNARVIVEAGALDGRDTVRLAEKWPEAQVHAFEPVPSAFAKVVERTARFPRVSCYPLALADRTADLTMYVSADAHGEDRPDSSSLLVPTGHLVAMPEVTFREKITVRAVTLSEWANTEGVQDIDLLWLDLQGMELQVLRASCDALARTRAVVMEVSRQEMYSGSPLYPEVLAWMRTQGFALRIDRVSILFGNALFVRR